MAPQNCQLVFGSCARTPTRASPLLIAVTCPQVSESTGSFELQLESVENVNGELADGECCDGPRGPQDLRCTRDECDTYFRVCLKEYQVEAAPSGPCTFGTGSTPVLGGNIFSFRSSRSPRGDEAGQILIPFQFAWPVSPPPPHTHSRAEQV